MPEIVVRPTTKFIKAGFVLVLLLVIAVFLLHARFLEDQPWSRWLPLVAAVFLLWPIERLIRRQAVKLTITGDKLRYESGFLATSTRIIQLPKVQDVRVNQSLLQRILGVGDLAIDLISRTASRRGKGIDLLPKEFQLLEYLVRNEGRVVSRAMLLQHVWDLHFDPSTNIIDVYVGRVRRKVDDQQAYPLIHTIRGIGYSLRAPG